MTSNNAGISWVDRLTFGEFDLEEVANNSGVRDVMTTLENTVSDNNSVSRGLGGFSVESSSRSLGSLITSGETEEGHTRLQSLVEALNGEETVIQGDIGDFTPPEVSVGTSSNRGGERAISPTNTQSNVNRGESEVENNEETVSLQELFSRRSRLSDLDNQSNVTISDIREDKTASAYTKPNIDGLMQSGVPMVEFGEDVVVAEPFIHEYMVKSFKREGYDEFNLGRINDRNDSLQRQRQEAQNVISQKYNTVRGILRMLFGNSVDYDVMYGYDKIGKTEEGLPYIKAVLATRFSKLYDRRFRTEEELEGISENVAVANKNPSVRGFIEMIIQGEEDGQLSVNVLDEDGQNIPYLESKIIWLKEHRVTPDLWVLLVKTQYEFEETITRLEDLKTIEFTGE